MAWRTTCEQDLKQLERFNTWTGQDCFPSNPYQYARHLPACQGSPFIYFDGLLQLYPTCIVYFTIFLSLILTLCIPAVLIMLTTMPLLNAGDLCFRFLVSYVLHAFGVALGPTTSLLLFPFSLPFFSCYLRLRHKWLSGFGFLGCDVIFLALSHCPHRDSLVKTGADPHRRQWPEPDLKAKAC